ncbi:MAG: hypothetical protein WA761_01745 [Thermoplasmata archaeon]
MGLRLRDSLTGRVEPIQPARGGPIHMYVCGPTVYDRSHVGHGRTYLYFDLIRRYLRQENVPTRHVMNITDFEDKVTARATELGLRWDELARREEAAFFADMDDLGILRPHLTPRASAFVPQMIRLTQRLSRRGRVRREGDEWLFMARGPPDPRNFPIGQELEAHTVPEPDPTLVLKPAFDREFMVWKRQAPPSPSWPSPWGNGIPGWHLECYAMAEKYLGIPVDLHGGGTDLIYPHHYAENEIALTLEDQLFSRHFLHTGFVTQAGEKMSKHTGNLVPLRTALSEEGPDALRMYLWSRAYHLRLDWSEADFHRAGILHRELEERCRGSIRPGAGGSLPIAGLVDLRDSVLNDVGDGLRVDVSMDRLRRWSARVGRSAQPRFARGERGPARELYSELEEVLGISLIGRKTGRPRGKAGSRAPKGGRTQVRARRPSARRSG